MRADPLNPSAEILLLQLQPVIDRLQALGSFQEVGSSADLATVLAEGTLLASPSVYVIFLGASPYQVRAKSGPLTQLMDVTIGVVVAVNLAGFRGQAGLAQLERPVGQARGALFGWAHPDAEEPFHFGGESVEDFNEKTGVLAYRIDFVTTVRIQETNA